MTRWSRTFAVLAERTWVQFQSPVSDSSQTPVPSAARGSSTLFWPSRALHPGAHTQTHKYWCLLKKSEFRSLISIQLIHVDYSTPPLDYQSCVTSFRIGKCEFSRPFFPLQYWRALPALFCSMWTLGAFCEVWKIDTKYLLRVFCHLWVLALNHRIEEIINTKHRRINQPE